MIYQGKQGSVCFYFENKLVGSLPLGKRTMKDYEKARDTLLREALEDLKLKEVKRTFWRGIHKFKQRLLPEDNEFICMTILCLIKLRQIDPDSDTEGLLVCGRKKPSKRLVSH
jgi:hypothetical protein